MIGPARPTTHAVKLEPTIGPVLPNMSGCRLPDECVVEEMKQQELEQQQRLLHQEKIVHAPGQSKRQEWMTSMLSGTSLKSTLGETGDRKARQFTKYVTMLIFIYMI